MKTQKFEIKTENGITDNELFSYLEETIGSAFINEVKEIK